MPSASGTVGPSGWDSDGFNQPSIPLGNVPANNETNANADVSGLLIMTPPAPAAGYRLTSLVFRCVGTTQRNNDGYIDPGNYIRFYAYVDGVQVGYLGGIGAGTTDTQLTYTYSIVLPKFTIPTLKILSQARGFSQYGRSGAYTTSNPASWLNAYVDWTAASPRGLDMMIG